MVSVGCGVPTPRPAPVSTVARTPLPTWTLPVQTNDTLQPTDTSTPIAPTPTQLPPYTHTPTPPIASATCADLDTAWAAADWALALTVVEQLEAARLTCGDEALADKRYAAHINYAAALETQGEEQAAIEQYRSALTANGRGNEALQALIRLKALPEPTPPPCQPEPLPAYTPVASTGWVRVEGEQLLTEAAQPFTIRGVNYYPRHAAWEQFLTHSDPAEVAQELDLIAAAGFNTLRIFVWYDPLFTCAPEEAVPNPAGFARLDEFIAAAHARGLYLIVTLHDLPDLIFRPLYTDWARYDAQTAFIVHRYQNEPTILAWDLRNEGDLDYDEFGRRPVLDWLAHAGEVVRANDSRHLLTAGWFSNAAETASIVDLLSFHHWRTAPELAARIEQLRAVTDRPILLEEVGYPSAINWDEAEQAQRLRNVLGAAEQYGLAGWLVWVAFDFPSPDPQTTNAEYFYGLWRLDLSPKPALEAIPRP